MCRAQCLVVDLEPAKRPLSAAVVVCMDPVRIVPLGESMPCDDRYKGYLRGVYGFDIM